MHSRSTLSCVRTGLAAATPALLLALVAAALPAAAQAGTRSTAIQDAKRLCRPDRDRLCARITPGGGRIFRCLAAKADQLSPDCHATLVAAGLVPATGAAR